MAARLRQAIERAELKPVALVPALAALIKALSGSRLRIGVLDHAELADEPLRPVLSAAQLLLPRGLLTHTLADPDSGYTLADPLLAKAVAAHACAHLLFSQSDRSVEGLKPMAIALVSAIEDARVEALLCARFPGVAHWFIHWAKAPPRQPQGSFADRMTRLCQALLDPDCADEDDWIVKARRMFAQCAQQSGLTDYWAFRRLASVLANDLGQMRVRFNPSEYLVPLAYRDDNSFLWADPKATQRVTEATDMKQAQSAPPPSATLSEPRSSVCADERITGTPGTLTARYPEWDYRSGLLRQDWCTVIESMADFQRHDTLPPLAGKRAPTANLRQFTNGTLRRRRGQFEGDWLDIDAAIRHVIEQRLALDSDLRHYVRRDRHTQTLSLLLLLDLSASANDIVDASGSRLIELSREAALALAEALANAAPRTAIHGFRSDTRLRIGYERFLDFGADLDDSARKRLRSARAGESTRLGAALRHALRFLNRETSDRRLLIVLSDGIPSDIDVFDTHYLARDAARAVQDLRRAGIDVSCITPGPTRAITAREIFGSQNVLRVVNTQSLITALSRLVSRRLAG